jgi:hypothetical protein
MRNTTRLVLSPQKPALDLNFYNEAVPSGVTFSGAANGTRVNSAGNIAAATTPRFDYDPVSRACKGMLIEEQRQNLLLQAADPNAAAWTKARASIANNAITAPDGTLTGDKLVEDGSAGQSHYAYQFATVVNAAPYTWTQYAKPGERTWLAVDAYDGAANNRSFFNLATAAVGTNAAGNTAASALAGGGWVRNSITRTTAGTGAYMQLFMGSADNVYLYNGDNASGLYPWGMQLEAGLFATSVILNGGTSLTRTADSATYAWTLADGTYAVEFDLIAVTGTRPILSLDDGTADNQIRLYASGTSLKLTVTAGGVTQADLTLGTVAANTTYKAAFSVRTNEFLALMNGGALQSDLAETVPVVTTGRIGSDQAGNYQNGHSKRIRQWKQRKNLWQLVA